MEKESPKACALGLIPVIELGKNSMKLVYHNIRHLLSILSMFYKSNPKD